MPFIYSWIKLQITQTILRQDSFVSLEFHRYFLMVKLYFLISWMEKSLLLDNLEMSH
jgi:hypothetical protein